MLHTSTTSPQPYAIQSHLSIHCNIAPRWHLLSSPLYDVSDYTNHIFSVRIWSWQHVSVIWSVFIAELSPVSCCLVFIRAQNFLPGRFDTSGSMIARSVPLLPNWSPFGDFGPHGDQNEFFGPHLVPIFFQSPHFLHFRPKNASKVSAATI